MGTDRKRRALTADDLLRKQEEPHKKRLKFSPPPTSADEGDSDQRPVVADTTSDRSEDEDEDSTSEEEIPNTQNISALAVEDRFGFSSRDKSKSQIAETSQPGSKPTFASFSSLGISAPLQAALTSMSILNPTEVQAACIPPLLSGESGTRI